MSRPLHQTAILTDPAAHWPARPSWTCDVGCGDWPCERLRAHLLATMPAGDVSLAMGAHYLYAVRELDADAAEVHRRFFGWARGPKPEPPDWPPPGGPW